MLTNEKRREILETARAVDYKGSILDLFNAAKAGQDISQMLQPQNMEVAQSPEQQSQGLRPQHAAGNTNASMAFPDVPPNTPFSTEGMKAPINISKFDEQGHLVQSFKNVPPGIQSLPTGPGKGTVIETPAYKKGGYKAKYQLGGVKKHQTGDFRNLDPRLSSGYNSADATSVNVDIANPNIVNRSTAQRIQDESTPQTVSTYVEPSLPEKLLNRAANPFTTAGYAVRGQQIPDRVGSKENVFDMAADIVNPAAYIDYGRQAFKDYGEGNVVGGTLNAMGALPFIPGSADDLLRTGKIGQFADEMAPGFKYKKGAGNPYENLKVTDDTFKGVVDYGVDYDGQIAKGRLDFVKNLGKELDDAKFDANWVGPEHLRFHGSPNGRSVVEVAVPGKTHQSQLFYKSSGLAGKSGKGVKGTTQGLWQPYGGHTTLIHPQGPVPEWFIKDAGYENFYGSKSFEGIANRLDGLTKDAGFDMAGQLNKYQKGGYRAKYQTGSFKDDELYYGTLNSVDVTFDKNTGENILIKYPHYNELSSTDRKYFNDPSPIGRGVKRKARVGDKSLYSELQSIAETGLTTTATTAAEYSGLAGALRFSDDPIDNLKGAGSAFENFMMGTNPMASSFTNTEITPKESQQFFNTLDVAGIVGGAAGTTSKLVSKIPRIRLPNKVPNIKNVAANSDDIITTIKNTKPNASNFDLVEKVSPLSQKQAKNLAEQGRNKEIFDAFEEGANTIDDFVKSYTGDLSSPEGFKRLVNQEADYLRSIGFDEARIANQAEVNAGARLDEIINIRNSNRAIVRGQKEVDAVTSDPYYFNNASYTPNTRGADYLDDLFYTPGADMGAFNLNKTKVGAKVLPGQTKLGTMFKTNRAMAAHEIGGHGLQSGRRLPVDSRLKKLQPLDEMDEATQKAYDYFMRGMEPSAFAHELRQAMLDSKLIRNRYNPPISPELIKRAQTLFSLRPSGTLNTAANKFHSNTRILDFMKPTKFNFDLLARELNDLPAIAPIGIGVGGTAALSQKRYGGYRTKYQTAGPRLKTYTDYDKFTEHNNAYQDSTALNKYYKAQLQAEEMQPDRSRASYDAQLERQRAGEIDTSKIGDLRRLGNQIVENSDGRLQWSGSGFGSTSPDLQYYNVQDDSNANIFQKMYSSATEGKSLIKGADKYWLGNAYNATWDKPKVKPVFVDESDPYGASKKESTPMRNQPVLEEEEWESSDKGDGVHESTAKNIASLRKKYPKLDSLYTTPNAAVKYNDRIMNKLDKIDPETSSFMPSDTSFYDSNLGLVVNAGRYSARESAALSTDDGSPFGVETYMNFSEPSVKKESAVKLTPKSAKLGNYTPLELMPAIPPRIHSRKLNQQSGQYMYDTSFGKFNLDRGPQDANFVRTYRTQIDDLRRNRSKYQFGGREGDTFQEVDTYIKPGQSIRPTWAQTPNAVTNYTFGKNLVDAESRFSLGLQGTDILDEIKYRADLIGSAGIGVGNRKGKSFRPAGENLRAGIRGQASWQGVPGNVLENMFPRSGVNVRGSFEGEAGLAYANNAISPYMSVTPQTNFSLNDNLSLGVGYEMRGRYDKNRDNPIYGSTGTGTVAPLSQRDAYSGMGRGAGRLSLKYNMGDGDFIEGYYSKPNSLYQGSMYPAPGVIALENEGPRFGVRLKKSF